MSDEDFRPAMNGLVTDPSAILSGDSGFVECTNAVCKRPGLVETRGGFFTTVSAEMKGASLHYCTYAREIGSKTWYVATDGTTSNVYEMSSATVALTTAAETAYTRAALVQDRYAWTFPLAMRMLDDPATVSTTSFQRLPGVPRAPGFSCVLTKIFSTGYTLPPSTGLAYRCVIARKITTPSATSITRGAPSDRLVIWCRDAPPLFSGVPVFTVQTDLLAVGDTIEIYRTVTPSTWPTDPGDEMILAHSYTLTALAATYTWSDYYTPGEWGGPALYTNDSQEGLAASNYRVRIAKDVTYYNSMAFYAQPQSGHTTDISVLSILNANVSGSIDYTKTLYTFPLAADSTNGSPVLTNCNPTVATMVAAGSLAVGQVINLAASDPEAASQIKGTVVSWAANTITISANATVTAVATALMVWDWLGVETSTGVRQLVYCMPYNTTVATVYGATSGVFYTFTTANQYTMLHSAGGQDIERTFAAKYGSATIASGRVMRLYTASSSVHPYTNNTAIRCQWDDDPSTPGASDFTTGLFEFISSKPYAFSKPVGLTYSANLVRSQQEGFPGRLAWSKLQQPESVPLTYYNDIGDRSKPIVRIVSTTDRLWIFKADGLWSMQGDSPEALDFQQVDPTLRMPFFPTSSGAGDPSYEAPDWVRKVGNTVYAWTTKGIFAIDPGGTRRVDDAIATDIRAVTPDAFIAYTVTRAFSGADDRQGLVLFGCRAQTYYPNGFVYALHTETGAWSKFETNLRSVYGITGNYWTGSGDGESGKILLGSYDGSSAYYDPAPRYDANLTDYPSFLSDRVVGGGAVTAINVLTVDATGTIITTSGATIIEGCQISQSGPYPYMVLDVTGANITVDRAGLTVAGATVDTYPVTRTITYASSTEGAPAIEKFFRRAYLGFGRLRGGTRFKVRFRARDKTTPSSWVTCEYPVQATPTTIPNAIGLAANQEYERAVDVATDHTRATGLAVTYQFSQAGVYFAIDSMSLRGDQRSDRTGGRS